MAEDLRIFGGNFDTVNALRVTAQAGGQLLYTTGDAGSALILQTKTVTPSVNAQQVSPDEGYYGLSRVNSCFSIASTQAFTFGETMQLFVTSLNANSVFAVSTSVKVTV